MSQTAVVARDPSNKFKLLQVNGNGELKVVMTGGAAGASSSDISDLSAAVTGEISTLNGALASTLSTMQNAIDTIASKVDTSDASLTSIASDTSSSASGITSVDANIGTANSHLETIKDDIALTKTDVAATKDFAEDIKTSVEKIDACVSSTTTELRTTTVSFASSVANDDVYVSGNIAPGATTTELAIEGSAYATIFGTDQTPEVVDKTAHLKGLYIELSPFTTGDVWAITETKVYFSNITEYPGIGAGVERSCFTARVPIAGFKRLRLRHEDATLDAGDDTTLLSCNLYVVLSTL